jgi:hypothetical protein
MFCPSCGAEYGIELKYCNRCGANLSTTLAPEVQPAVVNVTRPTLIISVLLLLITLGGFSGLIRGTMRLATILEGNDSFMAIIMFGMLTILVVDIFLVRLLSKLISAALNPTQQRIAQPTLSAAMPGQFPNATTTARLQSMPSVTENTTRFFEPYSAPAQAANPISAKKIEG